MEKPDVDYIEGLSPAVSIDQKGTSHNPRSTVGTVTEIYDYLRLLYARVGIPHCPVCGREVAKQSAQEIVDVVADPCRKAHRMLILSPLVRGRKGTYQAVFEEIRKAGFVRARVDRQVFNLDEEIQMDRYKIHTIEAVVDRLVLRRPGNRSGDQSRALTRLTDSIETALKFGDGYLTVQLLNRSRIRFPQMGKGLKWNRPQRICISPSTWPAPSTVQAAGDRAAHLFIQHPARGLPGLPGVGQQARDRP